MLSKFDRPPLFLDAKFRNDRNNWKNPKDQFNKMFRFFDDNKGIQNVGGFRFKSKIKGPTGIQNAAFVLLITNFKENEWPDSIDLSTGIFTYWGDNREPGNPIHKTHIGGNKLLAAVYNDMHEGKKKNIPPFLCFENLKEKKLSSMKFLGLAAPGGTGFSSLEDLTAVWRVAKKKRFQNYKAVFSILAEEIVPWPWLDDLVSGVLPTYSVHCPKAWKNWVKKGSYKTIQCQNTFLPRTKNEQLPQTEQEKKVLKSLSFLTPYEFEVACKEILQMLNNNFVNLDTTPRSKDRGRDIVGFFKLGLPGTEIFLEVIGEVKKWKAGIGVKPMSRLISRLKHRDLGIFLTTSYFNEQVQKEIHEDRHPILLISGGDIAKILISNELGGNNKGNRLDKWVESIKVKIES